MLCRTAEDAGGPPDLLARPAIRELARAGLVEVDHLEKPSKDQFTLSCADTSMKTKVQRSMGSSMQSPNNRLETDLRTRSLRSLASSVQPLR